MTTAANLENRNIGKCFFLLKVKKYDLIVFNGTFLNACLYFLGLERIEYQSKVFSGNPRVRNTFNAYECSNCVNHVSGAELWGRTPHCNKCVIELWEWFYELVRADLNSFWYCKWVENQWQLLRILVWAWLLQIPVCGTDITQLTTQLSCESELLVRVPWSCKEDVICADFISWAFFFFFFFPVMIASNWNRVRLFLVCQNIFIFP